METSTSSTPTKAGPPILEMHDILQEFRVRGGAPLRALDDVSVAVHRGETLGIVGESGCGKSTLARVALSLQRPTAGSVHFDGENITHLRGSALHAHRRRTQMVFQDPNDSFDPRISVGGSIAEPLRAAGVKGAELTRRVSEAAEQVGLQRSALARSPHEFSGGQRQRMALARALTMHPAFIVLDEPTSALDVSVQAQILNLLNRLQEEHSLTYLFISHNLAVIHHLADRVAVMYLGRIVEVATREELFAEPRHPYTRALLSAVPDPTREVRDRIILTGDLPSPQSRYPGCSFAGRCWLATQKCLEERPPLASDSTGRTVACHYPEYTGDPLPDLTGDTVVEHPGPATKAS